MYRIDTPNRLVDKFGTGKDGYTEGVAGVSPPTALTDDMFDAFQEEICAVIEDAAITLSKSNNHQLLAALDAMYAPAAKGVTNGDSHNHDGGDGGQIAYSSLSGLPTLGGLHESAGMATAYIDMVLASTWYDAALLTLGAGTWQVMAQIQIEPPAPNSSAIIAIDSGGTVVACATMQLTEGSGAPKSASMHAIVILTGNTTVKVKALSAAAHCLIRDELSYGATYFASGATHISAVQIHT